MASQNFQSTFSVQQTPEEVFAAIINPGKWWTGEIEGSADRVGDEFSYRCGDAHYSKQKVSELVPGRKVTWQVVDSRISGPEDPSEWTGTEIVFEISPTTGRPSSGSPTSAWFPSSSASIPARTPGASLSTRASGS